VRDALTADFKVQEAADGGAQRSFCCTCAACFDRRGPARNGAPACRSSLPYDWATFLAVGAGGPQTTIIAQAAGDGIKLSEKIRLTANHIY
jgi:hypothetical protein